MDSAVGKPIDRVDGKLKVTGMARYAAEAPVQRAAYATIVQSSIAAGKIKSIDDASAKALPGVISIITHLNMPSMVAPKPDFVGGGVMAEIRMPLMDESVYHVGQHIAVVVAQTLEQSRHAASLLRIEYDLSAAVTSADSSDARFTEAGEFFGEQTTGKKGDVDAALIAMGAIVQEATYTTPGESHNPMEPSATTAVFEADRLTVYDSTQWVVGTRAIIADAFGIPRENVRVIAPFIGGGFGCKGFIWPHTLLAVMAAKVVGQPVKLVLTRSQMFTSCGHRPATKQVMSISATSDGKLTAIRHNVISTGSKVGTFIETCAMGTTRAVYDSPNLAWKHESTALNIPEPTFMRAPGECPGSFALESAMDELAYKLQTDPLELRLKNLPREKHPNSGLPWSSYNLDECLTTAAEKFGWKNRKSTPGAMKEGDFQIGYGMAVAMFPGVKFGGAARLRVMADGRVILSTSAHEIGQGAYTALTQIAAGALGLPAESVKCELGDSILPPGPLAGGSNTTGTASMYIHMTATALKKQLGDEKLSGDALIAAVRATGKPFVEAIAGGGPGPEMAAHAFNSFGAHFVEVAIDPLMPRVQVRRVVSMFDVGRIINPKMANSQGIGGITMGIGMALTEATVCDARSGKFVNDNLADYAIPVNKDVGSIEVMFTNKPDPYFNPDGVRGVGEIGITGVAAAIANAVYHATGKRVRDLPILPHKLL